MVQGTNFPPISQEKGVKKNHALSQSIVNESNKVFSYYSFCTLYN